MSRPNRMCEECVEITLSTSRHTSANGTCTKSERSRRDPCANNSAFHWNGTQIRYDRSEDLTIS